MILKRFLLLVFALITVLGIVAVPFPDGLVGLLAVTILSAVALFFFRKYADDKEKEFITTVFLVGLALRLAFGIMIEVFELREFFGGDAYAYDARGASLVKVWLGEAARTGFVVWFNDDATSGASWGMNYFTGFIYLVLGRNIFAAQSVCAVVGAATAPMVYFCSHKIFNNLKVSRIAAISVAVFPSFIIWSGQLLKDGIMIFLLITAMTMVLQLQKKFSYAALALLVFSLFGVLSVRFYIFYMAIVAVAGSFVVGLSTSNASIFRRSLILVALAVALLYLGVGNRASIELETFGSLQRVQSSRLDLSKSASSGFGQEADVSTAGGALSAIPLGFTYLMLAPFPWQAVNLRQAITIPEVLAWWIMLPFLIMGLWYSIKHRLRNAFPILIFSLLLTIAYSVFQGNVGTAYRQRTQIQVFLFIFIAVGFTLYKENGENKRIMQANAKRQIDENRRRNEPPDKK